MGLHNTAHYLKSKGRGRDTELVHMSKREIKGLQDLALAHGGTLSINPETGLVEAGFLEQILPVVAAAGLTYLTAGAAAPTLTAALGGSTLAGGIAAGALSGAAISGGLAAIQGKDAGQAALMGGLGGALSGGLGAYDAGNVFNAPNLLADTSQKAVTEAGTQAVTQTGLNAGVDAAGNAVSMANPAGTGFINPETGQAIAAPLNPYATQAGMNAAALPEGAARNAALEQLAGQNQVLAEGSKQLTGQGLAAAPQPTFYSGLGNFGKAGVQALPVAGVLEQEANRQQIGPQTQEPSKMVGLSPNFKPYTAPQPNPYYRERYPTYAAEGGIMQSYQMGGSVDDESGMDEARGLNVGNMSNGFMGMGSTPSFNMGGVPEQKYLPKGDAGKFVDSDTSTRNLSAFDAAMLRNKKLMGRSGIKMAEMPKTGIKSLGGDFSDVAAAGGVAHLGDYSDGGRLLKGPGDGVSDNIPATIGGKQPARLADGEFVVPARIVSELGNGSTDAGAKRLYAMMDRVQKARKKTVGKGKIAKDSKSSKYLPA